MAGAGGRRMTRKKVRHVPTEAELVDRLDSQAVRDMLVGFY